MIEKVKALLHRQSPTPNSVKQPAYPADFTEREISLIEWVSPYTMTSPERIVALIRAVDYVVENDVQGDFVECGVWRGGSMMIIARVLMEYGIDNRKLFLYDTFEGMSEPLEGVDLSFEGDSAKMLLTVRSKTEEDYLWCYSPIDEVKKNTLNTGYNQDNVHFIKGKVEDTLPAIIPDTIALLRLDTDWYESTYHELVHLYPKLVQGGILIIDDYGHWQGAQKATDDYIQENKLKLFLNRMDYTGRLAVKL